MTTWKQIISPNTFANEQTLAAAGVAEVLGAGATTFVQSVSRIIVSTDLAAYIAASSEKVQAAAAGRQEDRIYLPAGTTGLVLPWSGDVVYFLNAVAAETPKVSVVGLV